MTSMTGLVVDQQAFELVDGNTSIGDRRFPSEDNVTTLDRLARRYAESVRLNHSDEKIAEIGRELHRWLEGATVA